MFHSYLKVIFLLLVSFCFSFKLTAQTFIISGKIVDVNTEEPIDNVTIQLKGLPVSTLSKDDGSFVIESSKWSNSLELTSV
ncbi:MAG TPA: hypothetical protein VLS85_00140, partial [Hanamia sp.]|nr:hypothetical protein [Hanamia sp.]